MQKHRPQSGNKYGEIRESEESVRNGKVSKKIEIWVCEIEINSQFVKTRGPRSQRCYEKISLISKSKCTCEGSIRNRKVETP